MSTTPPLPDPPDRWEAAWPASGYRHSQRGIYREAAAVLFADQVDIDTIVLDVPTGLGKSVINTGLCNLAASAFYTTPQKALRQQLQDDELLANNYEILRARRDYMCEYAPGYLLIVRSIVRTVPSTKPTQNWTPPPPSVIRYHVRSATVVPIGERRKRR